MESVTKRNLPYTLLQWPDAEELTGESKLPVVLFLLEPSQEFCMVNSVCTYSSTLPFHSSSSSLKQALVIVMFLHKLSPLMFPLDCDKENLNFSCINNFSQGKPIVLAMV